MGEFSDLMIGNDVRMGVDSSKTYFSLAFLIAPDVETIELYRLGTAELLTYRIDANRLYSVRIYTNSDPKALSEIKKILQKGNYNVVDASESLAGEIKGVIIHYRKQAESQAREISQRLMMKFKVIPTLEQMALISDVDIVIWVGE